MTTPTVREALRRLEATGIVEFRHGSRTYVGTGIDRRVLANPHRPTIDRESVLELVDARLVLEAAAGNALHPPAGDTRPAVHFHVALAAASGNRLLEESMEALLHVRVREQIEIRHRYDDRERDHAEHVRILAAIRKGDPKAAERRTRTHLESIRSAIETAEFDTP